LNPALPKQSIYICKNMDRLGQKDSLSKKCFKKEGLGEG
jgi:hypothetical protein